MSPKRKTLSASGSPQLRSMLARLRALDPLLFENLSYDLLVISGLKNLVWRTPGADGGRDIEGDFLSVDFSGGVMLQRWYVECKRYASSVDWPTVFVKLSYAQNQGADYLLFCTTGVLSPRCKEEISLHNARKIRPTIRTWEASRLETMVNQQPLLLAKYGLAGASDVVGASILPLVHTLLKVNQAAYGSLSLSEKATPAFELSVALAELIGDYLSCLDLPRDTPSSRFRPDRDLYEWAQIDSGQENLGAFRSAAFRYALAVVHFMAPESPVRIVSDKLGEARLHPAPPETQVTSELTRMGSLYGNICFNTGKDELVLGIPQKL